MFDGKAFGQEMVGIVKTHIERSLSPILARLDAIEHRFAEMPTPKDGQPGKDAEPEAVAAIVAASVRKDIDAVRGMVEAVPPLPDFAAMIAGAMDAASVSFATKGELTVLIAEAVAAIPAPQNGKDADPEQVAALVKAEAERILAGWERPANGKDGRDGVDGVPGEKGEPGINGKDGRDGLDVKDLFVAENGELIATFSDGRSKNLGQFRGKDGAAGSNGKDADLSAVEQMLEHRLAEVKPAESELVAPTPLAERISAAVKMMAQLPEQRAIPEYAPQSQASPNFTVNLPPVNIPPIQFGENVIHVSVPEQKAPEVRVEAPVVNVAIPEPKKRKTETSVIEHDERGRISKFVQREL